MSPETLHPALETMEPRRVAELFDMICKTPRPSHKEAAMRAKIRELAEAHGFKNRVDEAGNIAIDIPGSPGCETLAPVVLQAHMDMVCLKKKGVVHDFDQDPIRLVKTGDWLHAEGKETTLGADDGIGMSLAMAIAEAKTKHPPLTLLFTVNEEDGMDGAKNFGKDMLPKNMTGVINLDSEEGANNICHGSASGNTIEARWDLRESRKEVDIADYTAFQIELRGLRGGHSGVDCHDYAKRGNAIRILNDLLLKMREQFPDFLLECFDGGEARNSLPMAASAIVYVAPEHAARLQAVITEAEKRIKPAFEDPEAENQVTLKAEKSEPDGKSRRVLTLKMRDKLLETLRDLPDGPLKKTSPRLVTLSNNVGVVRTHGDTIQLVSFARAAVHEKDSASRLREDILKILNRYGAQIMNEKSYVGWQEPEGSAFVELAKSVVDKKGDTPVTFPYHAGLELKEIADRLTLLGYNTKAMSFVAIGPHIREAHSVRERVEIPSVKKVYELLTGMLEKLVESCKLKVNLQL